MSRKFNLPHIEIESRRNTESYKSPQKNYFQKREINRKEHGRYLKSRLNSAFDDADKNVSKNFLPIEPEGVYLEIELEPNNNFGDLERKTDKTKPCSVKKSEDNVPIGALYVPNSARQEMNNIFETYAEGELTKTGKPQKKGYVEPISDIRVADIRTIWIVN